MLTAEQLAKYPDRLVELYVQAEADMIADIARRISTYDYFIPAAEHQFNKVLEMGSTRQDVVNRLSKITGKSRRELEKLMNDAGYTTLKSDDRIYKAAGLSPKAISQSPEVLAVIDAGLRNTQGLFDNLTRTTANTATKQFERALDQAYLQVTTGGFDPNTAIRNAVRGLAEKGIGGVEDKNGRIQSLESSVRRAVVTGVNQMALKAQEARADEMNCDLVETTAHAGARPEHAEWQGRVFSRSGKHKKYPDFKKSTGYGTGAGLGGWNCGHSFYPFFEGLSDKLYTDKELDELANEKYIYNGKEMNAYEASQKQRYIERQIRNTKKEMMAYQAAGLDDEFSKAAAKLERQQRTYADFSRQTGLKKQDERHQVAGFGKSISQRGVRQAKKKVVKIDEKSGIIKIPKESKDEHYNALLQILDKKGVEYIPVVGFANLLSPEDIIKNLCGGDTTTGSCASVGLAYIGQRQGYNVLDFRGGDSLKTFSSSLNLHNLSFADGLNVIRAEGKSSMTVANRLVKQIESGKEYYLCVGRHASIVRKNNDGVLQYLELQSAQNSGWTDFNGNPRYTLKTRFGCRESDSGKWDFMIDIDDSNFKTDDFRTLLGYINTATENQKKGASGYAK